MTSTFSRRAGAPLALLASALAGCGGLQVTESFLGIITPYRIEVVQGNVITSEQIAAAKPG
jgi:outer membrane protein assembly factor BamE